MIGMRRVQALCLSLIITSFGTLYAQEKTSDASSRAIRDVVARYMQARNDKDAKAIPQLFTSDADQLVSTGEWRKGINELVRGTSASSKKEKNQSSITVESIRLIDPSVAIVDGRYRTVSLDGQTRDMWTTLVLRQTAGAWRIAAIRNMLPSSPAAAH
jgi:uncharacterized protein (TIGR02246 family)